MADIKPCCIFFNEFIVMEEKKRKLYPSFYCRSVTKKSLSKDDERKVPCANSILLFLLGCIMRITYGKSIIKYARCDVVVAACIYTHRDELRIVINVRQIKFRNHAYARRYDRIDASRLRLTADKINACSRIYNEANRCVNTKIISHLRG